MLVLASLGIIMADLPLGVRKLELYALHKSVGVVVFAITAGRLLWRFCGTTPALLGPVRPYERTLARTVHWLFYIVLLAMPLSGWLMSSAASFSVSVFGLFTLPDLIGPDKSLEHTFAAAHEALAWVLGGLVTLHVAGAAKHHVVWRDDTLRRMIPAMHPRPTGSSDRQRWRQG